MWDDDREILEDEDRVKLGWVNKECGEGETETDLRLESFGAF